MKMPNKVIILGKPYRIEPMPSGADDFGRCQSASQLIQINPKQAYEQLRDTLLHEVLHAVSFEGHLALDEHQVHVMANILLDTLRRNPKFTQFLIEKED